MKKFKSSLVIVGIIICSLINHNAEKELKKEYEKGRKVGYSDGYSEIELIYQAKIEELEISYTKRINDQRSIY